MPDARKLQVTFEKQDPDGVGVSHSRSLVSGDAVADLTGTTGGTANGVLEDASGVVTGVDGVGSNAASKADVDTRLTAIANNAEEFKADLAAVKAQLRKFGIVLP